MVSSAISWRHIAGECVAAPLSGPTVVGEGEECNSSLPPQYATVCDDGFACVQEAQVAGASGTCVAVRGYGSTATSCGGNSGAAVVNCQAEGDTGSYCVYGDHCACTVRSSPSPSSSLGLVWRLFQHPVGRLTLPPAVASVGRIRLPGRQRSRWGMRVGCHLRAGRRLPRDHHRRGHHARIPHLPAQLWPGGERRR